MRAADFRLDRLTAALLSQQATLQRKLAMKDETQAFQQNRGFVFLIRGGERLRLEDELASVDAMLQIALAVP